MVVRNLRWMAACLVALAVIGLAPARSNAEITILIQELNVSGGLVASQSTPFTAPPGTPVFTGEYFAVMSASLSTNSTSLTSPVASFTPNFSAILLPAFQVGEDHKLRITFTDNNFTPAGTAGRLEVELSGSGGLGQIGELTIVEDTTIFNPADGSVISLRPNLISQNGAFIEDTIDVSNLSNKYGIQQVLTLSFSGAQLDGSEVTFGATGGAFLRSSPVPAPGGLALALIGLPLIGLRRALRKTAA
jgi:hypothetical protein